MQSNELNQIHIQEEFKNTGLKDYLIKCYETAGFHIPTPIQYYAIKLGLANCQKNMICRSKSGTGKTLAYLSLLLNQLLNQQIIADKTYTLIILPTRQLAMQVYQVIKKIIEANDRTKVTNEKEKKQKGKLKQIQVLLTIGGIGFDEDRKKYQERPANIIVSTVGRLWEMFSKKIINFSKSPTIVFDEGDKLFDSNDSKFTKVSKFFPSTARKLVFSATFSKKSLTEIVKNSEFIYVHTIKKQGKLQVKMTENMKDVMNFEEEVNDHIESEAMHLANIKKFKIESLKTEFSFFDAKIFKLKEILSQIQFQKCLIFVEKKILLDEIYERLIDFDPLLIHGSLSQAARFRMMNKANNSRIIITSDLLARGIDLQLDLVVLFDARQTETFWHRIGRTGRYGRTGIALSLDNVEDQQWKPYNVEEINKILKGIDIINNKVWYGEYMTDATKWVDVNEEKEVQLAKEYQYFEEEQEQEQKPKKRIKPQIKLEIPTFTSQQQFKKFVNKLLNCEQCMQTIKNTAQLTGYNFEILKFKQ